MCLNDKKFILIGLGQYWLKGKSFLQHVKIMLTWCLLLDELI